MARYLRLIAWMVVLGSVGNALAQNADAPPAAEPSADRPAADQPRGDADRPAAREPRRGRGGFGGPIELGPDDKPAFDDPPADFRTVRDDIPHGKLEMIEYDS
jgi:hypothetical protein